MQDHMQQNHEQDKDKDRDRDRDEDREQGQRRVPRSGWAAQTGVFLALAFLTAGLCGALQPATGIPPEVLQLTQFGPALAVAAVALLWPGRIRDRLAGTLPARSKGPADHEARLPSGNRAALLLTPALITALSAGGALLISGSLPVTSPQAFAHPLTLLVTAQLIGACAEEIGWRCYLQPLLRTRFGPVTASVLVGTAWGLWHVPALTQGPAYAAGFLTATITMSVILGLALERVRSNRLLLAGGFHTLVNLGMLFVTDETSPATAPMVVFGGACLAAAIPWIASARRAAATPDKITAATADGPR
ncbi:CPBP family intramembrane glutamic endopeptidase [Streptomyces virginiae]|uniref:CPBP family intramembrane metalloprotease n=1 Tax=Streptomyces virginiae TaxID=1961 RepID=A0ABZ1TMP2_STRVG|nr:CPBP family intramembrane glutamic endopeptidase [Streptomyces virginiae]